jgi:hypothetical protein
VTQKNPQTKNTPPSNNNNVKPPKAQDIKQILSDKSTADSFKNSVSHIIVNIKEFKTEEGNYLTQKLVSILN